MSILCGYCHNKHETVVDVKICYGILSPVPARFVRASDRQIRYAVDLGGDYDIVSKMSMTDASSYIDRLKRGEGVSSPTAHVPVSAPDPKVEMFNTLLPQVPDGRFAVRADDTEPFTFIRLKRHTHGKLSGCVTIQTQHSEKLMRAGIMYRGGRWYFDKPWIVDKMLIVCIDPELAGHNYAKELGRCRICGKELTDERSRWYGIGPDCETRHLGVIERVDERNGQSYEQAHRALLA